YQTRYEEDAMMKADEAPIVLVVGKNGKKVTTTTYKLDTATGKVTENTPQVEVTGPVDEVIKKGVGKESDISYQVIYRADETRPLGVKTVSVKGQNGIMHPNGTITKAPVTEVVLVGIKPNVAEVAVPYHVVLIEDSTMLKTDPKIEIVAGKDGKAITTTSYALNETTGLVTVANVAKELIPAIDQEVKVGIGENKEIMYETRYVADEELEAGVTEVRVTGQVGVRHPNGTITTEPVTEIIAVGTMPKISEEILGFETIYQEDPNLPLGEMCVITPGKEGIKRLITTYTVDEVTGELIEMTSEEITEPQAEIVAKGTKVTQKEVVKTPEVKSVVAQTKEQPVPKSQELPQMGDKNKADTAMLLGSLGVLSALGLVAFSKKRKEER
uniref:G5 domain-containing protein n=1 Tax=uncultured Ligilactobacillus sp. TaxID=2837633 RepID=UPI00272A8FE8